jgi:hypothetical protein
MDELIEKYYKAYKLHKESKYDMLECKKEIEELLDEMDEKKYKYKDFTVERKKYVTERILKQKCPPEIWNKYCNTTITYSTSIRKKGEARSRSLSR